MSPRDGQEPRRTFGSVYQHPRSRFLWIRYTVDGKERRESSGSTSRRVAEELLAQRKAELGLGILVAPMAKRLSFEDLVGTLRADYALEENRSWPRVESALVHLRAAFAGVRALGITTDRVRKYQAARKAAGASRATINFESAILRRMCKLAVENGDLPRAPVIATPAVDNARQLFIQPDEFAAIHAALPPYLQGPMLFAYITGRRLRSQVLSLQWASVDLARGEIRFEAAQNKNKRASVIPFGALPALAELLRAQRERTRALEVAEGRMISLVFHHDGRPIVDYRKAWRAACRAAAGTAGAKGLGVVARPHLLEVTPHDMRRSAVRNMVDAGITEVVAMQIADFRTRSIFDRYHIRTLDDQRRALEELGAHLGGALGRTPTAHRRLRAAAP